MTDTDAIVAGGIAYRMRRATAADVAAIVGLIRDDVLGRDREPLAMTAYESAFAAIDADPNQLLLVVEDPDARVVATMQVSFLPGLSRGGALRAQLEAVRVAPDVQGGGLGSAFLAHVLDYRRRRGAALVQLTTDKHHADAHRFYERAGFVASHEGMKLELR